MIVAMSRIDRDVGSTLVPQRGERIAFRTIVHRQKDHGPHVGPELARIGATLSRFRHPVHVALRALRKPGIEARRRQRDGIGRGDAADVEAERLCAGVEALPQVGLQKSRSA